MTQMSGKQKLFCKNYSFPGWSYVCTNTFSTRLLTVYIFTNSLNNMLRKQGQCYEIIYASVQFVLNINIDVVYKRVFKVYYCNFLLETRNVHIYKYCIAISSDFCSCWTKSFYKMGRNNYLVYFITIVELYYNINQ